jgi:hypothetical protein
VAQSPPFLYYTKAPTSPTFLKSFSSIAARTAALDALKVAAHAKTRLDPYVAYRSEFSHNFGLKNGFKASFSEAAKSQATSDGFLTCFWWLIDPIRVKHTPSSASLSKPPVFT